MIQNVFIDFFTGVSIWELLLIFIAKIVEVSIGTIRVILITKGYRKPGTLLAVVEILLWVFVASVVISGVADNPIKGVIYSLGFAAGVYIGSLIESRIAVGKMEIHVISSKTSGANIAKVLRRNGYGVTQLAAKGRDLERALLMIYANRKNNEKIIEIIKREDEKALIVAQEVSMIQNGFIMPWKRIGK